MWLLLMPLVLLANKLKEKGSCDDIIDLHEKNLITPPMLSPHHPINQTRRNAMRSVRYLDIPKYATNRAWGLCYTGQPRIGQSCSNKSGISMTNHGKNHFLIARSLHEDTQWPDNLLFFDNKAVYVVCKEGAFKSRVADDLSVARDQLGFKICLSASLIPLLVLDLPFSSFSPALWYDTLRFLASGSYQISYETPPLLLFYVKPWDTDEMDTLWVVWLFIYCSLILHKLRIVSKNSRGNH
jgi:hypothetical protein